MSLQESITGKPLPDSYLPPGPIFGMVVTEPKPKNINNTPGSPSPALLANSNNDSQNNNNNKREKGSPQDRSMQSLSNNRKRHPNDVIRICSPPIKSQCLTSSPSGQNILSSSQYTNESSPSPATSHITIDDDRLDYLPQTSLATSHMSNNSYYSTFLTQANGMYPVASDTQQHLMTASQIIASQLAQMAGMNKQTESFMSHHFSPSSSSTSSSSAAAAAAAAGLAFQRAQQPHQARSSGRSNGGVWRPYA